MLDHYSNPNNKQAIDDERYKSIHNASESCIDDITVYMLLSDYWFEIEYGRKPTVNDGDGNLQIKIAEWIRQKNIQPHPDANGKLPTQKQLAYLITRKIHNEGYQGGDKDTGKGYLQSVLDGLAPYYIDKMSDALQKDIDEEVEIEVNKILRENLRFM